MYFSHLYCCNIGMTLWQVYMCTWVWHGLWNVTHCDFGGGTTHWHMVCHCWWWLWQPSLTHSVTAPHNTVGSVPTTTSSFRWWVQHFSCWPLTWPCWQQLSSILASCLLTMLWRPRRWHASTPPGESYYTVIILITPQHSVVHIVLALLPHTALGLPYPPDWFLNYSLSTLNIIFLVTRVKSTYLRLTSQSMLYIAFLITSQCFHVSAPDSHCTYFSIQ